MAGGGRGSSGLFEYGCQPPFSKRRGGCRYSCVCFIWSHRRGFRYATAPASGSGAVPRLQRGCYATRGSGPISNIGSESATQRIHFMSLTRQAVKIPHAQSGFCGRRMNSMGSAADVFQQVIEQAVEVAVRKALNVSEPTNRRLLSVAAAAVYLSLSKREIYNMITSGIFLVVRRGRRECSTLATWMNGSNRIRV